jgi:hypothetical protein
LGVVVTPAPSAQGACLSASGQADAGVISASGSRFVAVRSQRLVADETGAKLEVTDAWVDALSLGARSVARYEMPLGTVAVGAGGVKVYGFRDGPLLRAAVPIELVGSVRAPRAEPHAVTCRFASVALDTQAEGGEVAVVLGEVEVPVSPLATKTKKRPVQISLSTSRTASDALPVVSATVSWADAIHIALPDVPALAVD